MILLYAALFIAATLVAHGVWHGKGLASPYNPKRLSHVVCALLVSGSFAAISVQFAQTYFTISGSIAYPLEDPVCVYGPYVQQFDAVEKGQYHIDCEPDKGLLALENPYEPASRHGAGHALWDRSLYKGKYYFYFGITPILAIYYPYYFIKGSLPKDPFVVLVLLIVTTFFFPLSLFEWAAGQKDGVPLWIVIFGSVAATFATLAFLCARGAVSFYYIAVLSGMASLSLFLFFYFRAARKRGSIRLLLYLCSGISFALLIQSRLGMTLTASFFALAMIWYSIIRRNGSTRPIKSVISDLVPLGIPVVICIGFTMWWNVVRFASPFEFGRTYQLTITNITYNHLRLTDLPYAIFYFMIEGFSPARSYPYIGFNTPPRLINGHNRYVSSNMGLLASPFYWIALASPMYLLKRVRRSAHNGGMLVMGLLGAMSSAWVSFCLAGVIFRYTIDLTIVSAFACFIIFADFMGAKEKRSRSIRIRTGTAVVGLFFLAVSVYYSGLLSLIQDTGGNLWPLFPPAQQAIESWIPRHKFIW